MRLGPVVDDAIVRRKHRAGRAEKGAKAARAAKESRRSSPGAKRAERRRDADIRYLIREVRLSDRAIAAQMKDRAEKLRQRHLRVGREKVAEIRRSMRLDGRD
jgi:hypothetical protein